MARYQYIEEFEKIIVSLFELMQYKVTVTALNQSVGADLVAENDNDRLYVDVKFYRSKNVLSHTIKSAANSFAYYLKDKKDNGLGLIVVPSYIPEALRKEILDVYGISIWDRNDVYQKLSILSIDLRDKFDQLLLEAQQGTDTYKMYVGGDIENAIIDVIKTQPKFKSIPDRKGEKLCRELNDVPCGKEGWSLFEDKCEEILKFLFDEELKLWERQNTTDDQLSRFDLICRIASKDDYWQTLISAFNTRFILFEFKNYCDPITQGQIYTTERYLYNKGLRSVGFIIAKNGANDKAIAAAKGALKEHGKLILILSNTDLCNMLHIKDADGSANDYLSALLRL